MNFAWSEEQLAFKEKIIQFAQNELNDDIIERDKKGVFAADLWKKCADFGIQKMASTKGYGGADDEIDLMKGVLAMEGLGYGCKDNGLVFSLADQMWTVQLPILHFGTEAQKQKFLPGFSNGELIGAHVLTEKETGSDVFSMKMTADKVEGGYVLNGNKRLISLAPVADVFLVFANAKPKLGKWGVTAFLVEKGMDGFHISQTQDKMGLRTVPIGNLEFENCFVPDENRLGGEGAGMSLSNHSLEYERCTILAGQLGTMDRQLETAIKYAQDRKQFGQSIGKFQSVSNRIADMKLRIETSRLLLYKVAWLKQEGKSAMMESALLKLHLSESFVASGLDTIRIHGGIGYLTDTGVERDLRDAVGGVIYAGTSDIQRNIISRLLGL